MQILGIETSCDETALALVSGTEDKLTVNKSVVLSQIKKHAQYGGVVPEVAAREHVKAISPMLAHEIPKDGEGIDAIAVTSGPGLAPALRIGVETAKTLALVWNKPLIPVSHIEGHIYANWLEGETPIFPALCLVVSGGHTELILMTDHGVFKRLGETLDDASGEAFDKVASMLKLGYPGGPALAKLAEGGDSTAFTFPRGMLDKPGFDFSFSGLKTSVLYTLRQNEDKIDDPIFRKNIAASFQEAVVDVLIQKTVRAARDCAPASVLLAGGVSANTALRDRFQKVFVDIPIFIPSLPYTMDNAAMIAAAGYFRARDKKNFVDPLTLVADSNKDIV